MTTSLLKRSVISSAVALALMGGAASSFAVTGVKFDATGGGLGGAPVDTFTWQQNTVLAQAAFNNNPNGTALSGFLMGQGQLLSYDFGGSATPNTLFTYEFSIPVLATKDGSGTDNAVKFTNLADFGANDYFRMYATPITPLFAAGTGFGNSNGGGLVGTQTLILEGKLSVAAKGAKVTITDSALVPISDGGTGTTSETNPGTFPVVGGVPIVTVTASGSANLNIDVCQASEILGGLTPTASCGGQTVVSFVDTRYFRTIISALNLDIDFNETVDAPMDQQVTVPARVVNAFPAFGATTAGQLINDFTCNDAGVGGNNGVTPCDMYYGARRAAAGVHDTFAPEPATLALLGLGLLGIGFGARRKHA